MALQDDIFDIQDALKKKPDVSKAFDAIIDRMNNLEDALSNLRAENNALLTTVKILVREQQ